MTSTSFARRGKRLAVLSVVALAGCGGGDDDPVGIPQLAAAQPATLSGTCDALTAKLERTRQHHDQRGEHGGCGHGRWWRGRPSALPGHGRDVPPHQRRGQQVLRHRLRDAPAHHMERALLLPGQRRHRRFRRGGRGGARWRAAHRCAGPGLCRDEFRRRPQQCRGRGIGLRHRPEAPASTTATRPRPSCMPMAKEVIRHGLRQGARSLVLSVDARTVGAMRSWLRRATATSTTASWPARQATTCRRQRSRASTAASATLSISADRWPTTATNLAHRLDARRARPGVGSSGRASAMRSTAPPTASCRTRRACQAAFNLAATCRCAPARAMAPACPRRRRR